RRLLWRSRRPLRARAQGRRGVMGGAGGQAAGRSKPSRRGRRPIHFRRRRRDRGAVEPADGPGREMKRAWIIGGPLAAALLALAAPVAFGAWNPWAASYPQGVDVSAHQGPIDWRTLSANARFAYIKATEGADYVDPRFAFNWREAARVGMPHGAYHY